MKKVSIYLGVAGLLLVLNSCQKWLNIKPEDKFLESQVFSTPVGVYQAMNSNYLLMANPNLYGANLTCVLPEILAQNYFITSGVGQGSANYTTSTYSYPSIPAIATIWSSGYQVISSVNSFIQNLDKYKGVVPASEDSLLRGEAIAIRGLMHFDLLRLFGPMYSTADSTLASIPYYSATGPNFQPYLPANSVMDSVVRDLQLAEAYLANDPIVTYGPSGNMTPGANVFWQGRNFRLNLYAVKALEARVYLYRGDMADAYAEATWFIQNVDAQFKWASAGTTDRVFSSEVLFGLQDRLLYTTYNNTFVFTLLAPQILAPSSTRLTSLMESGTYPNDIRNNAFWYQSTMQAYKTFAKFADNTSSVPSVLSNMMPVIRKSELYYIAAECAPDTTTAIGYLNTVRTKRQVPALGTPFHGVLTGISSAGVIGEITKEYRKDLYGEGQLFFYYKRTGATYIPNGTSSTATLPAPPTNNASNTNWIYMPKLNYVAPIPTTETQFH